MVQNLPVAPKSARKTAGSRSAVRSRAPRRRTLSSSKMAKACRPFRTSSPPCAPTAAPAASRPPLPRGNRGLTHHARGFSCSNCSDRWNLRLRQNLPAAGAPFLHRGRQFQSGQNHQVHHPQAAWQEPRQPLRRSAAPWQDWPASPHRQSFQPHLQSSGHHQSHQDRLFACRPDFPPAASAQSGLPPKRLRQQHLLPHQDCFWPHQRRTAPSAQAWRYSSQHRAGNQKQESRSGQQTK